MVLVDLAQMDSLDLVRSLTIYPDSHLNCWLDTVNRKYRVHYGNRCLVTSKSKTRSWQHFTPLIKPLGCNWQLFGRVNHANFAILRSVEYVGVVVRMQIKLHSHKQPRMDSLNN